MDKIENISIVKKANIYFDGNVTSRTIIFRDGSKKTLGIILPGQYEFGTGEKEIMEILAGGMRVLFPGGTKWVDFKAGDSFEVSADSKFKISAEAVTDYLCSYIKE
jgi:uncharacterized protein YaiE (UPF0345 family)